VLEYLGRYTHRVAIGNQRLLALEDGQVSFAWTDYRDSLRKVMRVPAEEFIRLFLQHALPRGFQRIRYYGFLANCHRADQLALCRNLLATSLFGSAAQAHRLPRLLRQTPSVPQVRDRNHGAIPSFVPCHGPVPMLVDTS